MTQRARSDGGVIAAVCIGYVTVFALYGGVALLVQIKIEAAHPGDKTTLLAIVAGASAACATVVSPIGGALADRTRARVGTRTRWLVGGAAATLAAVLLLNLSDAIVAVAVSSCLAFSAANLFQAALAAIVPEQTSIRARGRASAAIGVSSGLGWAVGAQVVARGHGSGTTVLAATLIASAAWLSRRESGPHGGGDPDRASRPSAPSRYLAALHDRDFACVFAGRMLMMLSYSTVLVFLLYVLQDYAKRPAGLSPEDGVATLLTISAGCAVISSAVSGVLADRLHRYRPLVVASGCCGALGLLIPFVWPSWGAFIAFAAVQGAAIGIYYAADTALASLVLPDPAATARDMGVLNIAAAAPPVVAPALAAVVVASAGYQALFPVAAAGAVMAAISVLGVRGVR